MNDILPMIDLLENLSHSCRAAEKAKAASITLTLSRYQTAALLMAIMSILESAEAGHERPRPN